MAVSKLWMGSSGPTQSALALARLTIISTDVTRFIAGRSHDGAGHGIAKKEFTTAGADISCRHLPLKLQTPLWST